MLKNQRLTMALALALGSGQALALGLGAIEVKSGLNEPLVAEIALVSIAPGETEGVKVRLASPEAFARVGVDRPATLAANLEFTVATDERGQPVIRVTTPGKVRDPFLNFLLEVEWKRGRVLREYTVLLDPPVLSPMKIAPAATPPSSQPATAPASTPPASEAPPEMAPVAPPASTTPVPTPAPAPTTPMPAPPPPAPSAPAAAPDRYGPVASGQTLWSVAQAVRRDVGGDTNQLMLGLLRANPQAFIDGNINRLKTGAVLRIPTREEFAALSAAEAAAQVREQNQSWRQRATPQPVEAVSPPAASATTRPPETATRPSTPSDTRLEVVPPRGDRPATDAQSGASAAEGRELRAELARSREQVSVLEQENRELQSRVSDLEKIDADTRRLIELKDSQLAEAQRRLAELEAARAAAAAAPAGTESATPTPTEPVASAEPAPLEVPAETPVDDPLAAAGEETTEGEPAAGDAPTAAVDGEAVAPADSLPAEPVPSEPAVVESAPVEATPVEPAPPAVQPWWRNPIIIGGAAALLLGLFALLALGRRRRAAEPPRRTGVADAYAAAAADAAARAEQSVPQAAVRNDEQRLLDEIAEQPDDLGRHLMLVRHYYQARDAEGFEGAAEAMYAQLFDPEDAAWKQVLVMGRDLLPDHPLFAVTEHEQDAFAASLQAATRDDHERPAPMPAPVAAAPVAAAPAEQIDWGMTEAPAEPAPAGVGDTQRFSLEQLDEFARERADSVDDAANAPAASYDLDLDAASVAEPFAAEPAAAEEAGDDAAATKLELARAYLDMGDVEGARGMLEEVVGEGNPGQRSEARRLLDEIR